MRTGLEYLKKGKEFSMAGQTDKRVVGKEIKESGPDVLQNLEKHNKNYSLFVCFQKTKASYCKF